VVTAISIRTMPAPRGRSHAGSYRRWRHSR
jgi:hypothetical protein